MIKHWHCLLALTGLIVQPGHTMEPSSNGPASPIPAILKSLNGHWSLSVAFEAASGFPPGTTGKGTETWRPAVSDRVALSEESFKAGPIDASILGVLWWDGKEGRLHAMDCNNQGMHVCDPSDAINAVVVTWTGSALSVDEPEKGPDGKTTTSRITWSDIKPNSFTEIASIKTASGTFETVMTIHAVRAGK